MLLDDELSLFYCGEWALVGVEHTMSYAPVYLSIFFSDGSIYLTSPVVPCVVTIINPPRACTVRVTVVVLYVCVYVCPLIPAASHIGIAKERYQRILRNAGIVLNFADFPKKVMA